MKLIALPVCPGSGVPREASLPPAWISAFTSPQWIVVGAMLIVLGLVLLTPPISPDGPRRPSLTPRGALGNLLVALGGLLGTLPIVQRLIDRRASCGSAGAMAHLTAGLATVNTLTALVIAVSLMSVTWAALRWIQVCCWGPGVRRNAG